MPEPVQRKLTTIFAADAEGYSRMMEVDETGALGALRSARGIFSKFIHRHHGRIANTAGDGLIAEFPSVVEAVQCAIEVQNEIGAQCGDPATSLRFRIGIHLGDVMVDGNDLLGEGVNLAARLQTMAAPGDVLISQQVYDQVHSKLSVGFDFLGERQPRNFLRTVPVYRVAGADAGARRQRAVESYAALAATDGNAAAAPSAPARLRAAVIRRARLLGIIWGALVLINIGSGASFWSFWPGLAFAILLGLQSAPLVARRGVSLWQARAAVFLAALVLANVATWSGNAWSLWVAGAFLAVWLLRRFAAPGR